MQKESQKPHKEKKEQKFHCFNGASSLFREFLK